MALTYRTRKRLALAVLVIGLPLYIGLALFLVSLFDRPSLWVEFAVYVGLGIAWILPLRALFLGIGQADPEDDRAK